MATVLRAAGGFAAGMVVAFLLLIAVELLSGVFHPLPPGFDGSMEQMCQHIERYPAWVLAVVVVAWSGIGFVGTWLAGRVGNRGAAVLLGLLLLAGLVSNLSMCPYPIWFKAACVIAIGGAVAAGTYWSGRRGALALNGAG